DLWQNRLFLDASIKGEFPEELVSLLQEENVLWQSEAEDLKRIKENKVDLLGVNYYHPSRVQEPEYSSDSLAQDWRPDKYYASF
ncbi:family 1 glycosylhydrolase, partial [Salmonella enterica]